jgi:hypothetical protein
MELAGSDVANPDVIFFDVVNRKRTFQTTLGELKQAFVANKSWSTSKECEAADLDENIDLAGICRYVRLEFEKQASADADPWVLNSAEAQTLVDKHQLRGLEFMNILESNKTEGEGNWMVSSNNSKRSSTSEDEEEEEEEEEEEADTNDDSEDSESDGGNKFTSIYARNAYYLHFQRIF